MADFPEAGVRLVAETDDAMSSIDSLAGELDSLTSGSYLLTLETEVDTTGLDSGDLPVDGETITNTLDVEETDNSKTALDALNFLKSKAVLETIWNITGTAVALFSKFGGQILTPMLDLDQAVAHVNATTANGIPNARELIKGIFYDDLGESIGQVADLITQAHQINAPVEEATRAVLAFTHTFTDQNPQTVLNTMSQMVTNHLTPDFKTAGDVLVTAFQNGADRGKDLLQALNNNAVAIHDLGLNAPQALSFIKTGLDAGFTSAEAVLKSLETIKKNVAAAAGNPQSDVTKTLKLLGISNPAETGEAWSADFFKKVIDGIKAQPGLSDSEREVLFTNLIGGKQGGKTFSAFLQMTPDDADTIFANVGGAAKRAAEEADNHLKGAFDDFQLAVSEAVQNWLSSSAIDIPGKLAKLKEGLQAGLNTLAEGGSLSDALTIALTPIGFNDEFRSLESALGNFVIGILQAVAQLQDITGHGAEAGGTRATVAQMGATQLTFDLTAGNADQFAAQIQTAVSRGVSSDTISASVGDAVEALVKNGATAAAQALLDQFTSSAPNMAVAAGLGGEQISQAEAALRDGGERLQKALEDGIVVNLTPTLEQDEVQQLQHEINAALKDVNPTMDVLQHTADTTVSGVQKVNTELATTTDKAQPAAQNLTALSKGVDKMGGVSKSTTPAVEDMNVQVAVTGPLADTAAVSIVGLNASLQQTIDLASQINAAATDVANAQNAILTAQTTGSGGGTNGGAGDGPSIIAGLMSYIMGGSVGGASSVSNTINNNNSIPNAAVADALGYSQAATLRGMGMQ